MHLIVLVLVIVLVLGTEFTYQVYHCEFFARAVCQMNKPAEILNYISPANMSRELETCNNNKKHEFSFKLLVRSRKASKAKQSKVHLPGLSDLFLSSWREPKLKAGWYERFTFSVAYADGAGVSFRTFCSGLEPNVNDGCRTKLEFSGEYVPGATYRTWKIERIDESQNALWLLTRSIVFNFIFMPWAETIGWLICHVHLFVCIRRRS